MIICVLLRDGENPYYGMAFVVQLVIEKYFGNKDVYETVESDGLNRTITFQVSDNDDATNIVNFIKDISKLNPLYTVRIKEKY